MSPKLVLTQITGTSEAWQKLRAKKSYAEMSLDDFKKRTQPSLDIREEITALRLELKDALVRRNAADKESCAACLDVSRAVFGDKSEGPNSPFYKALGYVPHNERKTGLGRKKSNIIKAA